ncbi:hypothetical protein LUZ61_004649 [Rhynchospora tenuis]|uniref:Uncharacterized protein n=1 Tax=Rhynchospora tenuis TaxID=198213 RepID=A0AAD6ETX0_9POAL|nr:hypothetical protein LUZ61_004649 [Rhynchospora tenuis]
MDVDADDVASAWPFDSLASPSQSLLNLQFAATPSQSLLNLQFASPPSPLWVFDERAAPLDASSSDLEFSRLLAGEFDFGTANSTERKSEASTCKPQPRVLPKEDNNSDNSYFIKEKLTQALRFFKESTDQNILVQVWAPVRKGNRCVLTTSGQPFVLNTQNIGLLQYRTVSLMYVFSVDGENTSDLGLPGRVYRQKVPEWTPNVQYYSIKEYSRLSHAVNYNVRGTVALPVFEPSTQSCVAVLELIMTSPKINYTSEVDKVCKALEAVELKSTEISDQPNVQICNEGRQSALVEILETLTAVCESLKLPLAQTWVPCRHRSVLAHGGGIHKTCSSIDNSCNGGQVCMSASDVAFHVIDAHSWGFRDACIEHHLQKGQGAAGRAFLYRKPCFVRDVTKFSKVEYPLVHYAKMFGLGASFSVCLQSNYTGADEYVLEFFLPAECKEEVEQKALLDNIIRVMKEHFHSLKPVDGVEISIGSVEMVDLESEDCNDTACNGDNGVSDTLEKILLEGSDSKEVIKVNGKEAPASGTVVRTGKKRGKAEKMISLEVLQQYFSGSLKSAAKSLGVCPTTMKRICRHHGITRWPSRKINKVNRSLTKLKQVIESVQEQGGAHGAFTLPSLTTPLAIPGSNLDPSLPIQNNSSPPNNTNNTPGQPSRSKSSSGEDSINSRTTEGSCPIPEPPQAPLCGMLLEDSGSSKDLKDLCGEGPVQNLPTVTIKASYKDDIIRFRFIVPGSLVVLREEVSCRLKLEIGTFEIKYLDDDQEWVKLACDADLEECMEIARVSSKNGFVRLLVSDIGINLGSSCESTVLHTGCLVDSGTDEGAIHT